MLRDRTAGTFASRPNGRAALGARRALLIAAPVAAVLAGIAAEWLDFRALRYPILLMVLIGVTATAFALFDRARGSRPFTLTVALGIATWAAAETVYVVLHAAQGERFSLDAGGPQWWQAVVLVAAHGAFLGTPTGIVAALLRELIARRSGAR